MLFKPDEDDDDEEDKKNSSSAGKTMVSIGINTEVNVSTKNLKFCRIYYITVKRNIGSIKKFLK